MVVGGKLSLFLYSVSSLFFREKIGRVFWLLVGNFHYFYIVFPHYFLEKKLEEFFGCWWELSLFLYSVSSLFFREKIGRVFWLLVGNFHYFYIVFPHYFLEKKLEEFFGCWWETFTIFI